VCASLNAFLQGLQVAPEHVGHQGAVDERAEQSQWAPSEVGCRGAYHTGPAVRWFEEETVVERAEMLVEPVELDELVGFEPCHGLAVPAVSLRVTPRGLIDVTDGGWPGWVRSQRQLRPPPNVQTEVSQVRIDLRWGGVDPDLVPALFHG